MSTLDTTDAGGTITIDGVAVAIPAGLASSLPAVDTAPVLWSVHKLVLVDRLIAAGLADAANAALNANPISKMRWDAASEINSDDAAVRGFLAAIGGNPDSLLAP